MDEESRDHSDQSLLGIQILSMNNRGRLKLQSLKSPLPQNEKTKRMIDMQENKQTEKTSKHILSRERRTTLQDQVDKLKKRLKQEESVHKALQRAFTRPLGTLPRLSPYLPPNILELLAEVAVLEEEVARLEEQLMSLKHEHCCHTAHRPLSNKIFSKHFSDSYDEKGKESQVSTITCLIPKRKTNRTSEMRS